MKTDTELIEILQSSVTKKGSIRKWAAANGFTAGFVSAVLSGHKSITPNIAQALGYKRTERIWEKDKKNG